MKIELKKASIEDIELIHKLAVSVWNDHYPAIIGQEQVDYMLGKMYSFQTLHAQISESIQQFYIILSENNPIGFIAIEPKTGEELFIQKFYILSNTQNKGSGTRAFEQLLIRYPKTAEIRLQVNRQNFKAINFYFKLGFTIEKVADFDIGDGYFMNDFIMLYKTTRKLA
jgi:diamine N-acetyltransferase